jgi:hypothetical protein
MDTIYYDWFEILAEQSDEQLAVKALSEVEFEIEITDPRGFLVVDPDLTPEELLPFLAKDEAAPISPLGSNKVLIKNDQLRKYLEKAKAFIVYEFGEDQYLEVLFEEQESQESLIAEEPLDFDNLDALLEYSPIFYCWELLNSGKDRKELEEHVAEIEEKMTIRLDAFESVDKDTPITIEMFQQLIRKLMNDAILAVVYAWLKKFDKAQKLVKSLGLAPMRMANMAFVFRYYLEIMIAFGQKEILAAFFTNDLLRKGYLTHYEIYMQMFIDPAYECTRTQQITVVRRRIEHFREADEDS